MTSTDPDLSTVHHLGLVVADRDRTLDFLSTAFGTPGFAMESAAPDEMAAGDPKGGFRVALGFLRLGPMLLEITQPLDDRSPHAAFLATRGGGLHHMAFEVPSLGAHLPRFTSAGCAITLDGTAPGAPMRVAYLEGAPLGGAVVELMEPTPALDAFWAAVHEGLRSSDRGPSHSSFRP